MSKKIAIVSACAHRLYLYRPELFDSLREEGFEVTVMGPEPQSLGDEWLKKEGIPYVGLPLERRGVDPLAERRASSVITNTVKKEGIGLVFSYGIRFAPLANNSARRAGVPCMNVINGLGNLFIADGAAGERHEALPQDILLRVFVARRLHFGGDAEAGPDRGDVGVRDAPAAERGDERLLHLEYALGRERGLVQARLVDVVVDLLERDLAVVVGGEVDLAGVVVAGGDAVEVAKREFGDRHGGVLLMQNAQCRMHNVKCDESEECKVERLKVEG